jgi:hypothetical protein
MKTKTVSRRLRRSARAATSDIKKNLDILTGSSWVGVYEDSLYEVPGEGPVDYRIPAEDILITFSPRGKGDSTFVADRVIVYEGQSYMETFYGSVTPEGRVVMNSVSDTDILIGEINPKAGTLSFLFFDNGDFGSSLGSQTAVGTYVFGSLS